MESLKSPHGRVRLDQNVIVATGPFQKPLVPSFHDKLEMQLYNYILLNIEIRTNSKKGLFLL